MLLQQINANAGWGRVPRLVSRMPRLLHDIRSHPGWLPFFAFGRFMAARRLVSALAVRRGGRVAAVEGACRGDLIGPTVREAVETLWRDGICPGVCLSPEVVAEIQAFAGSRPCQGGLNWTTRFWPEEREAVERATGQSLVVGHFPDNEQDCPTIGRLIRDPWLHAVASGYFGTAATLLDVRLWWSFPSSVQSRAALKLAGQDTFHYDMTDWHQLKFFFYVTEVGPKTGPHRFVRGTHARRPLGHQVSPFSSKTDAEILATYGPEAMMTLTGPAGFGFAEDPFGYHTGATVQEGRRLCLEVSFGITGMLRRRDYGGPAAMPN
ncbi:phytanoyl-CoA dioxygenase family protein [Paracraurococcus lichenis]|uniref:Phytanoyl-CoA dioxygenase (PhyH) n=1 Tax=Paracraurococcus lichenis TaxID=3064888 RepID=A0ABT9DY19_9PROT|nr:hypothetical protein [Paracraurococcus sp. LOR1-02]MDO9708792.1 hypothetical protein [Paracraurococcus sp. LOR1-02]